MCVGVGVYKCGSAVIGIKIHFSLGNKERAWADRQEVLSFERRARAV